MSLPLPCSLDASARTCLLPLPCSLDASARTCLLPRAFRTPSSIACLRLCHSTSALCQHLGAAHPAPTAAASSACAGPRLLQFTPSTTVPSHCRPRAFTRRARSVLAASPPSASACAHPGPPLRALPLLTRAHPCATGSRSPRSPSRHACPAPASARHEPPRAPELRLGHLQSACALAPAPTAALPAHAREPSTLLARRLPACCGRSGLAEPHAPDLPLGPRRPALAWAGLRVKPPWAELQPPPGALRRLLPRAWGPPGLLLWCLC
ncbi:predicted GPI-anchored protein 58 [Panicum hallii]|uniref:predicted GPI-anchored protein 58 n=1 Tax=Panicum hallii TaxID=206008 RepID=UPI000DF4EF8F|nr:predicted GPI-anchored protein 58 [Panicum hallii]